MKTVINNNERVFQVVTSTSDQAFCNLIDLNRVIAELGTNEGYFTIYHFWDNKPKKVSKKYLRDLYKANRLICEFTY